MHHALLSTRQRSQKATRTQMPPITPRAAVQRVETAPGGIEPGFQHAANQSPAWAHSVARAGARQGGGPLPYRHAIERSFGRDLGGVRAHTGAAARTASGLLNANAVTRGSDILFAHTPDLRTTAHEASHAVMQQAGQAPASGLGRSGDAYEQRADAVAERVVAGQGAQDLLPTSGQQASTAVQLDEPKSPAETEKTKLAREFFPLLLSREHGASKLDPSLELKGTEWYDFWALMNAAGLSWGNMLLQNQALGMNAKGEYPNDWFGTFEETAKRNAKLFPGTGKEWTDQLMGSLSLIGGTRIPDFWGSDVFLELLKKYPEDVTALALSTILGNVIYAAGTEHSTIGEAEPGTMETQRVLRYFTAPLWVGGKLYESQLGKTIGSWPGMVSGFKPIWEQEPAGKGEKAGGELVINPSKFWTPEGTDISDPSKSEEWLFQLHGKYLYDRPATVTETGGMFPAVTDPSHSFTTGMVLGRDPVSLLLETSARLGEEGDLTSFRYRSGIDLFPKITGLDRLKLMHELFDIRAGDPLARGVDPGLYHRLFLEWSSGTLGKEWRLGANASMAFNNEEAWFTGAGGRVDYRHGGWPEKGEVFPAWGFSLFGGANNPQWWDKNAPLGGNVGLALNLGNFFAGGSFDWRKKDERMKELYGKEHVGGYQFGSNIGYHW